MKNINTGAIILLLSAFFILAGLCTKAIGQNTIIPTVYNLFGKDKWAVYPMINSGKTYEIKATDDTITIATLVPSKDHNMWYILQPKNNSLYVTGHIKIEGSMYFVYENKDGKMDLINKTTTY